MMQPWTGCNGYGKSANEDGRRLAGRVSLMNYQISFTASCVYRGLLLWPPPVVAPI
jgi:hypothetical protein